MSSEYLKTTNVLVPVSPFAVHATQTLKSRFALRKNLFDFRPRVAAIGCVACACNADMLVSTSVTRRSCIKQWYAWKSVPGRRKAVLTHVRRLVENHATSNANLPCQALPYLVDIFQIGSNAIKLRILIPSYARLWSRYWHQAASIKRYFPATAYRFRISFCVLLRVVLC